MLSLKIFRTDFKTALEEELSRKDMSIKDLAARAEIPAATIYKITSGERDPRFSTVRAIVNALDAREHNFIAVIAAKFLLDEVESSLIPSGKKTLKVKGYPANTMEDCIIAAVRAEKEGALGIICAPVLATLIERIVDIPVGIMKPGPETFYEAFESIAKRVE
ncbi:MAG: helix-turn-helix domain-containing protein [Methanomicrobiaceae archaeon]|nr:helix-turn-helix domain-containing protein [Methanomicrobiaceae archaeon]